MLKPFLFLFRIISSLLCRVFRKKAIAIPLVAEKRKPAKTVSKITKNRDGEWTASVKKDGNTCRPKGSK